MEFDAFVGLNAHWVTIPPKTQFADELSGRRIETLPARVGNAQRVVAKDRFDPGDEEGFNWVVLVRNGTLSQMKRFARSNQLLFDDFGLSFALGSGE